MQLFGKFEIMFNAEYSVWTVMVAIQRFHGLSKDALPTQNRELRINGALGREWPINLEAIDPANEMRPQAQ